MYIYLHNTFGFCIIRYIIMHVYKSMFLLNVCGAAYENGCTVNGLCATVADCMSIIYNSMLHVPYYRVQYTLSE